MQEPANEVIDILLKQHAKPLNLRTPLVGIHQMDERGLLMEGALKLKDLAAKVCMLRIFNFLAFNIRKSYLYFCFFFSFKQRAF